MAQNDLKDDLHRYLRSGRDAVLWKLDGLSEYDVRRPLVPTGTNLLGLVKHLAGVEGGYFGEVFGRPMDEPLVADLDFDADPNADLWVTADESRDDIVALYRRVWRHADATIDQLDLDAVGRVPWWPEGRDEVTLHRILVHVATETHRHAGHADIVRELIDGAVGLREGGDNLAFHDAEHWRAYHDRLEQLARSFADKPTED
ncbi:MAG TPA: DinB family protein [Egicoccus sp.]|nr:DinB family protein [Egicoccus sp.]HSK23833.1 DinB family protein [Egicoccus sp.]